MSLYDLACQQLWAMREGELRGMLSVLGRESLDPDLARQIREDRASRPSALAAKAGGKLDNTRAVAMRGSIAIMEIVGPIVRRADMFSEISGATDVGTLSRDFATAQAAPHVEAVLFVLDSPGGEVGGIAEFAAMIANATKPVWGYGEGDVCSAAYWIAASMDRLIVDKTTLVGSIGVAMAVPDPTRQPGRNITFVSSQSPHKRPDPTTEVGRGQLQAIVDATADEFVADVAAYRGVSVETVLSDFGQGGVMVGKAAVAANLVDAIGSFESALADLQAEVQAQRQQASAPPVRSGQMVAKEHTPMAKGFWAWMAGGDEPPTTPPPALASEAAAAQPPTAAPTTRSPEADLHAQALAENAALRAALAVAQAARITQDAQAWATAQITAGHALPAEMGGMVALYSKAAQADSAQADLGMVAALSAAFDARPANRLAGNLLPAALPPGAALLPNATSDAGLLDEAAASARAYATRANGKAS